MASTIRTAACALLLLGAACGDDTAAGGGGQGGGGGDGGGVAQGGGPGGGGAPSTAATTSSSGAAGGDACDEACGDGTSCQLCRDPLSDDEGTYTCAPLDPEPTADEFRCGEENCARRSEVCIEGGRPLDELVCGEPGRCDAIEVACDDCACAIEQIPRSFCVEACADDGNGGVHVEGTDLQGSGCLNCVEAGDPCTDDGECCALDGLGGVCNADGVCEETNF